MLATLIFFLMVSLIIIGLAIGFSLATAGTVGIVILSGWEAARGILATVPYRTVASYTLTTVPMFILMAEFVSESDIVDDVFIACHRWLERVKGGLAISTVIASACMAAVAGSSTASAAAMSGVAIPQLIKYGYPRKVAAGLVTVAGTLAIMIPPSVPLVLYGIITESSIGKLLIAGIIPGLMTTCLYIIGIILMPRFIQNSIPPSTRMFSNKERFDSLLPIWAFIVLAFVVIGSIYSGFSTATEAAAFGAFAALLIGIFKRRLKRTGITKAISHTIRSTTMIFTIIIGAMIFGYFLTLTQTPQNIIKYISALDMPRWGVLIFIAVIYLFLGCILDVVALLFISLPLTYPLVMSLGYDTIWFGILVVKLCEIGLITPPVGMNAYVVSASANIPLDEVFLGAGYMLLFEMVSLLIIMFFPELILWLPSLMIG